MNKEAGIKNGFKQPPWKAHSHDFTVRLGATNAKRIAYSKPLIPDTDLLIRGWVRGQSYETTREAVCSPKDNYSKEMGRQISLGRALQNWHGK